MVALPPYTMASTCQSSSGHQCASICIGNSLPMSYMPLSGQHTALLEATKSPPQQYLKATTYWGHFVRECACAASQVKLGPIVDLFARRDSRTRGHSHAVVEAMSHCTAHLVPQLPCEASQLPGSIRTGEAYLGRCAGVHQGLAVGRHQHGAVLLAHIGHVQGAVRRRGGDT